MGTELDKSALTCRQPLEVVIPLKVNREALSGIHRETVDDDSGEDAVVHIGLPRSLQGRIAMALAKVAIGDATTGVEHQAYGNDKDGGKSINQPHIHHLEQPDKRTMQPSSSIGRPYPRFLGHVKPASCFR